MKTLTVTLCKGLPASGKSSWAKAMVHDHPGKYVRVSRDDLRAMLHSKRFSKANEKIVTDLCHLITKTALANGRNVIVDETSLNPKVYHDYAKLIEHGCEKMPCKVELEVKHFDKSLEDCIRDDSLRENSVGKRVIMEMYWRWIEKPNPVVSTNDPGKINAIICDLDGTFANIAGRNPYDAGDCEQDTVNAHVLEMVKRFHLDHTSIFVSGRDDEFEPMSRRFIERESGFVRDEYVLFMRKTGDRRDDAVVKREIYDNHIAPFYNITLAIDDRPRVLRMWKSIGIPTCDVGDSLEF